MKNRIIPCVVAVLSVACLSACGGDDPASPAAAARQQATVMALSPSNPPGSNFNLAPFTLQLPTGSSGKVDTVSGSSLASGYVNPTYFYTDGSDGSMVMMDPTQGWTTSGSLHPRTELRENAIWPTSGTNRLNATVAVTQVPGHTTIGQIFQGTGPSKPPVRAAVHVGRRRAIAARKHQPGGKSTTTPITTVGVGQKFSYALSLSGTTITVTANGTTKTFTMDSSFNGESFYFKAGDYDQTAVSGTPLTTPGTVVKFYALTLTHS